MDRFELDRCAQVHGFDAKLLDISVFVIAQSGSCF